MAAEKTSKDNCLIPLSSEFFNLAKEKVVKKNGQLITPNRKQFQKNNQEKKSSPQNSKVSLCSVKA